MSQPQRPADGTRGRDEVTPLDLFSDLVSVFGVSQVSHHLLTNPTWSGALETFILFVPMFGIWLQTAWSSVVLAVDGQRAPWLHVPVMLLGLYMNASLGSAFDGTVWIFVGLYLGISAGRNLVVVQISRRPWVVDHYQRMLAWWAGAAVFWVLGALDAEHRLAWWMAGALIDFLGIVLAHPLPRRRLHSENEQIPRLRTFERARLFFIIALGETILTTGVAIAGSLEDPLTSLTGTVALVGTVALWWAYFDIREAESRAVLQASTDPTRYGVRNFNVLFVIVAAVVVIAVGDELVISHPRGDTDLRLMLALFVGPALYLATQAAQARRGWPGVLRSRLLGLAVLAVLAPVSLLVEPFVAAIPLVGVAVADGRSRMLGRVNVQPEV